MRYLETYKIFESSKEDIEKNCEDILVELVDNDYKGEIYSSKPFEISIIIGFNNRDTFDYSEISDIVERLTLYLETERYYRSGVFFPYGSKIKPIVEGNKYMNYIIEYLQT